MTTYKEMVTYKVSDVGPEVVTGIIRGGFAGSVSFYLDGELHCEYGPAETHYGGTEAYYLNGVEMSEAEHKAKMNMK